MSGEPQRIAPDLWIVDGPVVPWFVPFPTRMTLARLPGGLFVHSPIALTPALRRAVEALGTPRWLVSPNKLHHLFWADWQRAWPQAQSFAPPGLAPKRADLAFDGELRDQPEAAWAPAIDQLVFRGSRVLDEVVFFHRASRTLVLGDLVENFDPRTLAWRHRCLARLGGVLAPDGGTPLDYRLSFLGRRHQARAAWQRIAAWAPQRVLMCHGVPVMHDAMGFLERAFAWAGSRDGGA